MPVPLAGSPLIPSVNGSPLIPSVIDSSLRGVAHPACGVVHAVHAGDILVVNPAQGHCTTEFGDALATRKMIAIFLSRNALRACVTSHEVAVANGLQIWEPQQQLRCKRKR